jgi:hypothetical protein
MMRGAIKTRPLFRRCGGRKGSAAVSESRAAAGTQNGNIAVQAESLAAAM